MVGHYKLVARIIGGECGERSVHGVHFRNPISLFAAVSQLLAHSATGLSCIRHVHLSLNSGFFNCSSNMTIALLGRHRGWFP